MNRNTPPALRWPTFLAVFLVFAAFAALVSWGLGSSAESVDRLVTGEAYERD